VRGWVAKTDRRCAARGREVRVAVVHVTEGERSLATDVAVVTPPLYPELEG
jgi:hypothetical protein